ncbi:MAG TPA: flavodoxin family protein [Pseudolysinimonas sp.]|nr:flavodoxin family protein [Pseudolysinimonas sp.]
MLVAMNAVVVFESEFGATRAVAEAIARGLDSVVDRVTLLDARDIAGGADAIRGADLVVVGTPTHARMMPSARTRATAVTWPNRPGSTLTLQPHADAAGVREWLRSADLDGCYCAAFATRSPVPRILAGSASRGIARGLERAGGILVDERQDFLVRGDGAPVEGELDRAHDWGRTLAGSVPVAAAGTAF